MTGFILWPWTCFLTWLNIAFFILFQITSSSMKKRSCPPFKGWKSWSMSLCPLCLSSPKSSSWSRWLPETCPVSMSPLSSEWVWLPIPPHQQPRSARRCYLLIGYWPPDHVLWLGPPPTQPMWVWSWIYRPTSLASSGLLHGRVITSGDKSLFLVKFSMTNTLTKMLSIFLNVHSSHPVGSDSLLTWA